MQSEIDMRGMAALLDWYREMGVDTSVAAEPTNWLERGETAPGSDYKLPQPQPDLERGPARIEARADGRADLREQMDARERPPSAPRPSAREGGDRQPPGQAPARSQPAPAMAPPRPAFAATPPDAAGLAARTVARDARAPNQARARALQAFGARAPSNKQLAAVADLAASDLVPSPVRIAAIRVVSRTASAARTALKSRLDMAPAVVSRIANRLL